MSLTSHLSSEKSPVTQYFKTHFNFTPFLEEENKGLVGVYTIRPKSFTDYPWADMGHIVEYLLALHMGLPIEYLFPVRFAKEEYPQVFYEMKRKYDGFSARTQKIDFKQLTDDLYKLAKVEGVYRNGSVLTLNQLQKISSTQAMQEDLKTIYDLALTKHELFNDKKGKFSYNPMFDLSKEIGGADADLYVVRSHGNYLLDLKTTLKPVVKEEMMHQLLGYVFLDKSNKHKFADVGLYLPRQNLISEWKIADLVKMYSDFATVEEAKKTFIDIVQNLNSNNTNKLK